MPTSSSSAADFQCEPRQGYHFDCGLPLHTQAYLLAPIISILKKTEIPSRRMIDIGCGNGSFAAEMVNRGWDVTGVDPSESAIHFARTTYPTITFHEASGYDDLSARFGQFPVVTSVEVIEHVYDPRAFAATLFRCVAPGGLAIITTPYHGYWKNLALAVTGSMDKHFTALWDHGHIKFWSIATLGALLQETGFRSVRFLRAGRFPWFAKSMIAIARHAP